MSINVANGLSPGSAIRSLGTAEQLTVSPSSSITYVARSSDNYTHSCASFAQYVVPETDYYNVHGYVLLRVTQSSISTDGPAYAFLHIGESVDDYPDVFTTIDSECKYLHVGRKSGQSLKTDSNVQVAFWTFTTNTIGNELFHCMPVLVNKGSVIHGCVSVLTNTNSTTTSVTLESNISSSGLTIYKLNATF